MATTSSAPALAEEAWTNDNHPRPVERKHHRWLLTVNVRLDSTTWPSTDSTRYRTV
jgi:hypothetical protein